MKITEIKDYIHDWSSSKEGTIYDPRELIRKELNVISHEVYVVREQLSDFCHKNGIRTATVHTFPGSIKTGVEMDIHHDLDYSCFDTQGVNKRVIIYLGNFENPISDATKKFIKRQTIKLTNLHTEQQKLFDKLRKLGDEAAAYKPDTGWTFKPVQQKWM